MTLPETDIFTSIIARVFRVDEVNLGDPKQGYFLRYRGELIIGSIEAYEQLCTALQHYDITPLFRLQDGRQTILLIHGTVHPKPGRVSVNISLFVLTFLSVLLSGAMYSYRGPMPDGALNQIWTLIRNLWVGWPFAVSLLSILLAHEFGHYFVGRPCLISPSPVRWRGWWLLSRCLPWGWRFPPLGQRRIPITPKLPEQPMCAQTPPISVITIPVPATTCWKAIPCFTWD
jgi:hypothetical protein